MLHEEVLPEISRGDAEPDTIALIEGPDDTSDDIVSAQVPTSLISAGLPVSPETPVELIAIRRDGP
ncbi:hypothetical protein BS47DRAFT_1346284 [Hydnum rufescens UP504]|uniref:Uncharacterized protein n=1 Tax=Hydnum rufescens UP504 TaxID=1448309 RepID=A0A9P6ATL6_9AGAM|nr:hypothetical protein BS47DRAFT_1346284 [Hydnum rufescens UP504]